MHILTRTPFFALLFISLLGQGDPQSSQRNIVLDSYQRSDSTIVPSIATVLSAKVVRGEFRFRDFFRSWLAYWPPIYGPIVLVLDDAAAVQQLSDCFAANPCGAPSVTHSSVLHSVPIGNYGAMNQGGELQKTAWKFFLDTLTTADAIALFDDDACLQDHVIPQDLFTHDGRIVARGARDHWLHQLYDDHPKWFGIPASNVSYMIEFPVVIWREMLPDLRMHVNYHAFGKNDSSVALFLQAYHLLSAENQAPIVCEFCVLLNFAAGSPKWRHRYRFDTWPQTEGMIVYARHHFLSCTRPKAAWERDETEFVSWRSKEGFPWDSDHWWIVGKSAGSAEAQQHFHDEAMRSRPMLKQVVEARSRRLAEFVGAHKREELSWYERCGDGLEHVWQQCVGGGNPITAPKWYTDSGLLARPDWMAPDGRPLSMAKRFSRRDPGFNRRMKQRLATRYGT